MSSHQGKSTLDGMPKHFVHSLRTLFDILDSRRDGYVKLVDIESRWRDGSVEGLPSGVIDSLRKVTPTDGVRAGYLTFERFVAGLKIALLRLKSIDSSYNKQSNLSSSSQRQQHPNTAAVRPNNFLQQTRTKSLSQLDSYSHDEDAHSYPAQYRGNPRHSTSQTERPRLVTMETIAAERQGMNQARRHNNGVRSRSVERSAGDGVSSSFARLGFGSPPRSQEEPAPTTHRRDRRGEPRRHTLSNGIDYNMIKIMKQLEQEKDILLQGCAMVDRARDWYHRQIEEVLNKQKLITTNASSMQDYSVEARQEIMNFQSARIIELNQQIKVLLESAQTGNMRRLVPYAATQPYAHGPEYDRIQRLKAQNRLLTEEVGQKGERISQLEKEKSQLVKEMFESRSKNRTSHYDDTTFM